MLQAPLEDIILEPTVLPQPTTTTPTLINTPTNTTNTLTHILTLTPSQESTSTESNMSTLAHSPSSATMPAAPPAFIDTTHAETPTVAPLSSTTTETAGALLRDT